MNLAGSLARASPRRETTTRIPGRGQAGSPARRMPSRSWLTAQSSVHRLDVGSEGQKKWAKIVQKFDIVDKFKQFLLPKLMKNRVEKSLKSTINTKIDNVFTEIENTIDKTIKNKYQTKLEDYNRSLNKLRNERDKKTKDTDKKAIRIDENLKEIKKIKN